MYWLHQVLNKKGGEFTEEDESRLRAFTQQVAIALENAQLFEDVAKERIYNHSMLESMSNAVVTINEDGRIVTCNKAGLKFSRLLQMKSLAIPLRNSFPMVASGCWRKFISVVSLVKTLF